jgi:hypothetical protein
LALRRRGRSQRARRPDKYKVIINFRTAKVLGLTIPLSLAGLADEVIQ